MRETAARLSGLFPDLTYGEENLASLRLWQYDQAWLLVRVWGFEDEMEALFADASDGDRPRWYVSTEWE